MSCAEKVVLIEEHMKTIQKKWVELKTEVNNLDRKRRKARKKEREGKKINCLIHFATSMFIIILASLREH